MGPEAFAAVELASARLVTRRRSRANVPKLRREINDYFNRPPEEWWAHAHWVGGQTIWIAKYTAEAAVIDAECLARLEVAGDSHANTDMNIGPSPEREF